MRCDDAIRALNAGMRVPEVDIHLSACEECRAFGEDLAQLGRAFARARAAWTAPATLRLRLPVAPWRRLAVAAGLLFVPLAAWAVALVAQGPRVEHVVSFPMEARPPASPTDRELLTSMFMPESQP
jgi:predicted anti-sigma-YlaC factor YlaD